MVPSGHCILRRDFEAKRGFVVQAAVGSLECLDLAVTQA